MSGLEPFGVLCTLLKTRDQPKFGEKADEGYFLGYVSGSPNKRVFNKNTGRIEIVYNIDVTSYASITQSGPNWLYDYDSVFTSFNIPFNIDVGNVGPW